MEQNTKEWRAKNKDKIRETYQKQYYEQGGREKKVLYDKENRERTRIRERERYYNDTLFRMKKILRTRFNKVINGKRKQDSTLNLLNCDLEFFKKWISFQFSEEMNWDNYGVYWNIDHVKPCSSFDFSKKEDQKECFQWKNTRPCIKSENESKKQLYRHISY